MIYGGFHRKCIFSGQTVAQDLFLKISMAKKKKIFGFKPSALKGRNKVSQSIAHRSDLPFWAASGNGTERENLDIRQGSWADVDIYRSFHYSWVLCHPSDTHHNGNGRDDAVPAWSVLVGAVSVWGSC